MPAPHVAHAQVRAPIEHVFRADSHFVDRPDAFDIIKQQLLDAKTSARIWLHGLPGFGKTTLAKTIARDTSIIATFHDKIVLVTLGQQPNHLQKLREIGRKFGIDTSAILSASEASSEIEKVLQTRQCLLIVDDVWNERDLEFYQFSGAALIGTTRESIHALGFHSIPIRSMTRGQSISMLELFLGQPHEALDALANRLHDWPLLLALAGGNLRENIHMKAPPARAIELVIKALEDNGLTAFDDQHSDDRTRAVKACVEASLVDANRPYCYALGIFSEDVDIPIDALASTWGLDRNATQRLVRAFHKRSLLQLDLETETVRIHDALRDYYNGNLSEEDRIRLHSQLLDAWGDNPPNAYAWRQFRYHALKANRRAAFRRRILNFAWAFGKMKEVGLAEVLSDYGEFSEDDDAQLIAKTLRASAHAVQDDCDQLPSQVLGRLPEGRVDTFRAGALKGPGKTWLLPVRPTLEQAGGALTRTHQLSSSPYAIALRNDHEIIWAGGERLGSLGGSGALDFDTGEIHALPWYWKLGGHSPKSFFFCRDGRTLMYALPEKLLVFDLETGTETERLAPWPESVCTGAAAKTMAISVTAHGELLLWDIESGRILGRHQAPEDWTIHQPYPRTVRAVAINENATIAAAISIAGEVHVWDIDKDARFQLRCELERCYASALALTNDGKRLLIGDRHGRLTLWDIGRDGPPAIANQFNADTDDLSFVAISADGTFAISASWPYLMLRQWDLTHRHNATPLRRHDRSVLDVALRSDAGSAVSAGEDGLIYSFSTTDLELVQVPNQWPNVRWKKARLTKDLSAALVNVARSTDIEDLGKLWVLDLRTCGKSLHVPEWSLHAIDLAMSSNGKHIAYIERIEGAGIPHSEGVFLLGSPTDPPVCLSTTTNLRYYCIEMSADGATVAWGSVSGSIYVWQAATNVRIASPKANEQWHYWTGGTTHALAMALDGRCVLAVGFSGMVLWDIERWCLRNSIAYDERLHASHVAALTPDQRFAITGHGHGSHAVRLWDLQSGTCIATFTGESEITALATNGEVIVVGEASGRVHVLRIVDAPQSAGPAQQ